MEALEKSQRWAQESYNVYFDIASDPTLAAEIGLRIRSLAMLFPDRVETDKDWEKKMKEIQKREIHGFSRSGAGLKKLNLDPSFGVKDSYEIDAPVLDSDRAMRWLMDKVQRKGATLVKEEVKGSLSDQEALLLKKYGADAIVNATGLGARKLALDDRVYPVRGGVFRVLNDGMSFPKVTQAAMMNGKTDETGNYLDLVFILPRNDEILILGSIVQPHEHETSLTLESPAVQELWERLLQCMPYLKNARLDPEYPFAQGLRPFRVGGPRVERESAASRIVHSYGQGGGGWSMAFGCAAECASIVEEVLKEDRHKHVNGLGG